MSNTTSQAAKLYSSIQVIQNEVTRGRQELEMLQDEYNYMIAEHAAKTENITSRMREQEIKILGFEFGLEHLREQQRRTARVCILYFIYTSILFCACAWGAKQQRIIDLSRFNMRGVAMDGVRRSI